MKVFISHKSEDVELAKEIAVSLEQKGFKLYFDAYDDVIKTTVDRPSHIQNEIRNSTHLLVIVTKNTKDSWWVPFEIGLSTALDKKIATFTNMKNIPLPSFLRKWPVMDNQRKWDVYLNELGKNQFQLLQEQSIKKSQENIGFIPYMRESDLFHTVLMEKFRNL